MAAVHPGLAWARATDAGRKWLERLPQLVRECVEQWSLELGEPFPYAFASLALPARLADGGDAVLKICLPHRESEHEADALARWNGEGAVRLLAHDRERWALLVERCRPGTPLRALEGDAALDVVIGLLPRLWCPRAGRSARSRRRLDGGRPTCPRSGRRRDGPSRAGCSMRRSTRCACCPARRGSRCW
ncbi:MAG: aminoglycoside phosphotransferase family protein [Gaiellaceae bacterium]